MQPIIGDRVDPKWACQMVADGSDVIVPIEDRRYGEGEGRLHERFGHLWILSFPALLRTRSLRHAHQYCRAHLVHGQIAARGVLGLPLGRH